eukprot:5907123-Pyramimonas_sp.AAC.1
MRDCCLTLTKGVLYALDRLVNGILSAGHIDIIDMFGRKQVAARLELVIRRGSETKASGGTASSALTRRSVRTLGESEAPWPIQAANCLSKFLVGQPFQGGHVDAERSNDPLLLARCRARE